MPTSVPASRRGDYVTRSLARDRLGVGDVMFFVLCATTPLTVSAGVVTTGYASTGLVGIPVAFVAVAVILAIFAVGYVAMARHVSNPGAFYAYIAHGLGRPLGVGAAWLALIAYHALAIGLYGAIGAAASPLLQQWLHVNPAWWVLALAAWALTGILGAARVELNSRLLAVLLVLEIAVIVIYSIANLARPASGLSVRDALAPLNPDQLLAPGVGALLVIATLGFVGFESAAVFSEESRDRRRTVARATYAALAVTGLLYALASWAMSVATGPARVVQASRELGPELLFSLADARLGAVAADIGHVLFVSSLVAALISFHALCARYIYALGRERVLPVALGRTSLRTGAPISASLLQSFIGLAVILLYAVQGWDPITRMFFLLGTAGGLGVLALLTLTSFAVIGFFRHDRRGHSRWTTIAAPVIAATFLSGALALAVANLPTLLGVPPGDGLALAVPITGVAAVALGLCWGLILRDTRPGVYEAIGLGDAAAIPDAPSSGAWT